MHSQIKDIIDKSPVDQINDGLKTITNTIDVDKIAVSDRVKLSNYVVQYRCGPEEFLLRQIDLTNRFFETLINFFYCPLRLTIGRNRYKNIF